MDNYIIKTTISNGRKELIHSLSSHYSLPEAKKAYAKVNYKHVPYVLAGQYIVVSLFKYDNDTRVMSLIEEYTINGKDLDSCTISDEMYYISSESCRNFYRKSIRLLDDVLSGNDITEAKDFLIEHYMNKEGLSSNFNKYTKEVNPPKKEVR